MFVHVNSIYISYYVFFDFGTIWKCDYISHRYLLIFVCYLYVSWSPLGVDFEWKHSPRPAQKVPEPKPWGRYLRFLMEYAVRIRGRKSHSLRKELFEEDSQFISYNY